MKRTQTTYICDLCKNTVDRTDTTLPTDWTPLTVKEKGVRKQQKKHICPECTEIFLGFTAIHTVRCLVNAVEKHYSGCSQSVITDAALRLGHELLGDLT